MDHFSFQISGQLITKNSSLLLISTTVYAFSGDFPGAIQLLFEAKDAAKTYSHFRAIQQLSHNLQDTLELAEEQLDVALSKVCIDFKESTYARLQVLYSFGLKGNFISKGFYVLA